MNLRTLTPEERDLCRRVMSAEALYGVVVDALLRRDSLSVIRVSDGEKAALDYCEGRVTSEPMLCCDEGFRARFGVQGMDCRTCVDRIYSAAEECSHFAPCLGFHDLRYALLPYFRHPIYYSEGPVLCSELYQYQWSLRMRIALTRAAHRVVVINRDPAVAANISIMRYPNLATYHVPLTNWDGAEQAMEAAIYHKPDLVLMSAALGSKFIGPKISRACSAVVLDIGQAADVWGVDV
jgi:hypothetical protein